MAESRERAKALVMEGLVYAGSQKCEKPGDMLEESVELQVRGKGLPYVSRGGLKLEKAMVSFGLDLSGLICMDVGASTGGFTDCMLQNGAFRSYAVDVGYGQLAWSLRTDPRVVNLERVNARYLTDKQVPEAIDFCSIDVSFISLTKILPNIRSLLTAEGRLVCLIKPQFEAGKEKVGKKGVVRDKKVHEEVILKIVDFCLCGGFSIKGLTFSPVKGPEGNIEYLIYLQKSEAAVLEIDRAEMANVVENSHKELI